MFGDILRVLVITSAREGANKKFYYSVDRGSRGEFPVFKTGTQRGTQILTGLKLLMTEVTEDALEVKPFDQ